MRIVSIGEILFDCFQDKKVIGGAPFNFFYHVYKLTNNAEFISRIGNDDDGKSIIDFFRKNDMNNDYIQIDYEHQTGIVEVNLNENGIPNFSILPNRAYDFIILNRQITKLIDANTKLLYYGTLAQRNEVSRKTIRSMLGKNFKYFCDINLRDNHYLKSTIVDSIENADVLKLNEDELKIVSKHFSSGSFDLYSTAEKLRSKFEIDVLSVTLGDRGAILVDKSGINVQSYPAEKILDTVGAGDAYAAILCLGYLNKIPIERLNYLANKFAAGICSVKGAIPQNDEIYIQFRKEI